MKNIVACIDGSALSTAVCDASVWAAQRLHAPLTLLHALEDGNTVAADDLSGAIGLDSAAHLLEELVQLDQQRSRLALEHGKAVLEQARLRALQQGMPNVQLKQRHGDVLESLADMEEDTRVFVIGRSGEGHDVTAASVGSHVESTVRAVNKPVLISVGDFTPPKNFMIAYDGRETMDRAIERTANSDLLKDIPCHLVMVGEETQERQKKLANAKNILVQQGFDVVDEIIPGEIYLTLSGYQRDNDIDLVAIGAYARSRVRRFFLGSNTTRMIASSKVPLFILK